MLYVGMCCFPCSIPLTTILLAFIYSCTLSKGSFKSSSFLHVSFDCEMVTDHNNIEKKKDWEIRPNVQINKNLVYYSWQIIQRNTVCMDLKRTPSNTVDALQTERTKKTCCHAYGAKLWLWCRDTFFPENLVIRGYSILVLEFKDRFSFSEFVKNQTNIMFGFLVFCIIFFFFLFFGTHSMTNWELTRISHIFFLFNPCRNEIFFSAKWYQPSWSDQIK